MSMLDRLIGPFWEVAGALMPKRGTVRILSGATAVDNAAGDGSTDVTIQGNGDATSLRSIAISAWGIVVNTGWSLFYDSSGDGSFELQRGVRVIATGTVTANEDEVIVVPCADLAAGDQILLTMKESGGNTGRTCVCEISVGVSFSITDWAASDVGEYYYCVLRPAPAAPA